MNARKVCGPPPLRTIVQQLGWRLINLKRQLARRKLQLNANDDPVDFVTIADARIGKTQCKVAGGSCSLAKHVRLSADIARIKDDIAEFKDLLRDVVAWISEHTGILEQCLFCVALQRMSGRPEIQDVYREFRKLDHDKRTSELWSSVIANDSAALEAARLLRHTDRNAKRKTELAPRSPISRQLANATAEQLDQEDPAFKYLDADKMSKEIARKAGTTCSSSTVFRTRYYQENKFVKRRRQIATAETETESISAQEILLRAAEERTEQIHLAVKALEKSALTRDERIAVIDKLGAGDMTALQAIEIARTVGRAPQPRRGRELIRQ